MTTTDYIGSSEKTQRTLAVMDAARQAGKTVLLWGPPGVGKTALVRALAARHSLPLHILIPSTMDPTDVDGLPALKEITIVNDKGEEETATITENTLNHWAEDLIRKGKGILFFDEASTAVPAVQAALLSVLQGRRVGRHTLPKDVWMIAAANEASVAADGWELSPPMANRFIHLNFDLDQDDFYEGFAAAWNNPEASPAEFAERAKIVAFLKQAPTLISAMPDDASKAGGAWPSPRSWDALASTLAFLPSGSAARPMLIEGSIGEGASRTFLDFLDTLRLPEYETVLADPDGVNWEALSAGETYAVLSMVLGRLKGDRKNIEDSLKVFGALARANRFDVGASLVVPLIKKIQSLPAEGGKQDTSMYAHIRDYIPHLQKAGITLAR